MWPLNKPKETIKSPPTDGVMFELTVNAGEKHESISQKVKPGTKLSEWDEYRKFQKWFHGRPQSNSYSFKYVGREKIGMKEIVFLRNKINGFWFETKAA